MFFTQRYGCEQTLRVQTGSPYLRWAARSQTARNCPQGCSATGAADGEVGSSEDRGLPGSRPASSSGADLSHPALPPPPFPSGWRAVPGDPRRAPLGKQPPRGRGAGGHSIPRGGTGRSRHGCDGSHGSGERRPHGTPGAQPHPAPGSPGGRQSPEDLGTNFLCAQHLQGETDYSGAKKHSLAARMLLGKSGPTYAGN